MTSSPPTVSVDGPERFIPDLLPLVRSIAGLRIDQRNARKHPAVNLEAVKQSLATSGQVKPVVVVPDGTIIAGNGMVLAAQALGWTHIAAVTYPDVYYRVSLPLGGSWVVWDKRYNESGMDLDAVHGSCFELCWSKVSHKREIARVLWSGHHGMQGEDTKSRVHPTQKPVALVVWFLERHAGTIVVDLFLGSGSTLIAAEQLGRRCYAMEIDPGYVAVAIQRWVDATGGAPVKESA